MLALVGDACVACTLCRYNSTQQKGNSTQGKRDSNRNTTTPPRTKKITQQKIQLASAILLVFLNDPSAATYQDMLNICGGFNACSLPLGKIQGTEFDERDGEAERRVGPANAKKARAAIQGARQAAISAGTMTLKELGVDSRALERESEPDEKDRMEKKDKKERKDDKKPVVDEFAAKYAGRRRRHSV